MNTQLTRNRGISACQPSVFGLALRACDGHLPTHTLCIMASMCYEVIQRALRDVIVDINYQPPHPVLDVETWDRAFNWGQANWARNKKLEWMGDR